MQDRRASQRRLSSGERADQAPTVLQINDLPDVLLLEVFRQLSHLPPVTSADEEALFTRPLPFRTFEYPGELHPGLRAYPFLAQVCRHWKDVLETKEALQTLWGELIVDFGHELITGVHVPLRWSDVRPTDDEFHAAFASVRLRCHRLVDFVRDRRHLLRRLALCNSEGYWAEDGEFVLLASKHNFNLGTLGVLLGMLQDGLQDLAIVHCNDLFAVGSPLSTIAMLTGLQSLSLEDVQSRIYREPLAELGRLRSLTHLAVNSRQREGVFIWGIDAIPDTWAHLSNLLALELRGNSLLETLPPWLPGALPSLQLLDVSACVRLDLASLAQFTTLRTLGLQAMDLVCGATPERLLSQAAQHGVVARVKQLPDVSPLTGLRALNLADNNLLQVPPCVLKLRGLEFIDLSGNFFLQLQQASGLQAFAHLRWLDLRAVHVEADSKFWSPSKCASMQNITALAKALRRRNRHCKVLFDTT